MAITKIINTDTPAGSNTEVQYNDNGVFGSSSNLTFSGSVLAVTGDLTVNTGGADGGLSLLATGGYNNDVNFGDAGDSNIGRIRYDHGANSMSFLTNTATALTIDSAGKVGIGTAAPDSLLTVATGEVFFGAPAASGNTSNANLTSGLTINQEANDNEILALKSSDVAHGMTAKAETDTYLSIKKYSATNGGATVQTYTSSTTAVFFQCAHTTQTATRSTGATAPFLVQSAFKDGTGIQTPSAGQNLVAFGLDGGYTRFIFDTAGSSHQDVGTAWTNYDALDDVALTRSLGIALDPASIIQTKWDDWGKDHFKEMEDFGLIGKVSDEGKAKGERGLVNMTLLAKLHNGAISQIGNGLKEIREELELERGLRVALEARLNLLEN